MAGMRDLRRAVLPLLALLAACGGADLTLPGSGDPAGLSIVSGDGQSATVGEAVSEPLVVAVTNSDGRSGRRRGGGLPVQRRSTPSRRGPELLRPPTPVAERPRRVEAWYAVPVTRRSRPRSPSPGEDLQVRFRLDGSGQGSAAGGRGRRGGSGGSGSEAAAGGGTAAVAAVAAVAAAAGAGAGVSGSGHGHEHGKGHGKGHGKAAMIDGRAMAADSGTDDRAVRA